jgi:hypothetical protein
MPDCELPPPEAEGQAAAQPLPPEAGRRPGGDPVHQRHARRQPRARRLPPRSPDRGLDGAGRHGAVGDHPGRAQRHVRRLRRRPGRVRPPGAEPSDQLRGADPGRLRPAPQAAARAGTGPRRAPAAERHLRPAVRDLRRPGPGRFELPRERDRRGRRADLPALRPVARQHRHRTARHRTARHPLRPGGRSRASRRPGDPGAPADLPLRRQLHRAAVLQRPLATRARGSRAPGRRRRRTPGDPSRRVDVRGRDAEGDLAAVAAGVVPTRSPWASTAHSRDSAKPSKW